MKLKELKIETWIGDSTNCYIIVDEKSKETMVIDPAGDVDKIEKLISIMEGKLKYIFLTHCHGDHILGVSELKNRCGGKVLIHRDDSNGLNDIGINLTPYIGAGEIELEADSRVDDDDLIHLGNLKFKVIHTPGHTRGSVCYLYKNKLLSGDTLFKNSCGRTDFPTGSPSDMRKSLKRIVSEFSDMIDVYPGHEGKTKIKDEKKNNPYIL